MTEGKTSGGARGTTKQRVEGGCLCNLVRYRITGKPLRILNCHCTMCRRASGAPFVTWITVRTRNFSFTKMRPVQFESSSKADRSFCDQCGTSLTYQHRADRRTIDVTVGSLDEPGNFVPTMDVHTRSHVAWVPLNPTLKRHDGSIRDD